MQPNHPLVGTSSPGPGVTGKSDVGDGVFGEGENGVHGEAGAKGLGAGVWGENPGTGAGVKGTSRGVGILGLGSAPNGLGIRGIGAGGDTGIVPPNSVGVYGQGGADSPGLVGQAGPGAQADGVQGFGTGPYSGVAGFGDVGSGTGVFGLGGQPNGCGVRGIGAEGPNTVPSDLGGPFGQGNAVGVYGQGGPNGVGIVGVGGPYTGQFESGTAGVVGIGSGGAPLQPPPIWPGVYAQGGSSYLSAGVYARGGHAGPGVVAVSNSSDLDGPAIMATQLDQNGVAGLFGGPVQINGYLSVAGDLFAGTKSALVPFSDGTQRRLYCMESPECWFEDFGIAQLVNGQAQVQLDPGFASVVVVDDYHVFLTEYEDNNGLYVTGRTNTGFSVRAKGSPNASGTFSYRIVAKRKDVVAPRFDQVVLPQPRSADRAGRRFGADRNP